MATGRIIRKKGRSQRSRQRSLFYPYVFPTSGINCSHGKLEVSYDAGDDFSQQKDTAIHIKRTNERTNEQTNDEVLFPYSFVSCRFVLASFRFRFCFRSWRFRFRFGRFRLRSFVFVVFVSFVFVSAGFGPL